MAVKDQADATTDQLIVTLTEAANLFAERAMLCKRLGLEAEATLDENWRQSLTYKIGTLRRQDLQMQPKQRSA